MQNGRFESESGQLPKVNTIIFPNTITKITGVNHDIDSYSGPQKIVLPNNLKEIGEYAFKKCVSIKEINIPESIERVISDAFEGWTSEQNINVNLKRSAVVERWGYNIFSSIKNATINYLPE